MGLFGRLVGLVARAEAYALDVEKGPQDVDGELAAAKSDAAHLGLRCTFGAP